MNVLLDTHILLWWLDDSPMLKDKVCRLISDGNNLVFISAAVIWEIRIKAGLGKLIIPSNFQMILELQDFELLPITHQHVHAIADLPLHHRDPFDRLLVAQAMIEGFTLITHDDEICKYEVSIIKG